MSSAIGVANLFGVSVPSGCVVNESSTETTVEVKTIRSQAGVTVEAKPMRMAETKVMTRGRGIPALSLIAASSSVAISTLIATELNITESNSDLPDFDLTSISYSNLT
jgi:hypothetical protein